MTTRVFRVLCIVGVLWLASFSGASAAGDEAGVQWILPGKAALRSSYGVDALFLAGTGYRELESKTLEVSFTVDGLDVKQPVKRLVDGYWIQRVELAPVEGGSRVTVGRSADARGLALAVSPGSEFIPDSPNVVFSLTVGAEAPQAEEDEATYEHPGAQPTAAVEPHPDYPAMPVTAGEEGKYRFPPFKRKYKYSDVLVDFNLVNTDFRQVLLLMSEIGNVSIILDPYWDDAPTGGRRRPGGAGGAGGGGGEGGGGDGEGPGGPGGGGGGGGDGEGQGGFREAGTFQAQLPRSGTGTLTMNLQGVPFDLALDLILTAVNLEKIDIYPGFFDQPIAGVDEPERGQSR